MGPLVRNRHHLFTLKALLTHSNRCDGRHLPRPNLKRQEDKLPLISQPNKDHDQGKFFDHPKERVGRSFTAIATVYGELRVV